MPTNTPEKFQLYSQQQTKKISLVVRIEGLTELLTSRPLYTRIRYGDDIEYGDPGLVYGGLRELTNVRNILSLEGSSLTLSQKLEPEQGKSSVSVLNLAFVDDGFMTRLVSPGIILDDILGKNVTVNLGYEEISYPEDFFVIFRGKITGVTSASGIMSLQLSDSNANRRQQVFYSAKTSTSGATTNVATTINVASNSDFHKHILGPDGAYDPAIKTYLKIEDEFIEYGPTSSLPAATFGTNTFTGCVRGARGTTAAAHADGSDVQAYIEISDNAVDMALKLMLSGWAGPWETGVALDHIVFTSDPVLGDEPGSVSLGAGVDAIRDYGIAVDDYITISGSGIGGNNISAQVTGFGDLLDDPNRIIYTDGALTSEPNSPAVIALRSQFDAYPVTCGVKLTTNDVDVAEHIRLKNTFLSATEYDLKFLLSSTTGCKEFIEKELLLPVSAYTLTKLGRLSIGLTHPPIADETLLFLDEDNVLEPQNIKPQRSTNNRKFFNEITWEFDKNDEGKFLTSSKFLDTDSLNIIGVSSVLPISASGGKTSLGFSSIVDRSSRKFLSRYKRGATTIDVKVNWGVGALIEAGDVVGIRDDGTLQISNFVTGERDLGVQMFEVVDRNLDIKSGNVTLKLISGLGSELTDRYATISPSSTVAAGSSTTYIIIEDSYGSLYPSNEKRKWEEYVGEKVLVHNYSWTVSEETTFLGFDSGNNYKMLVSGLSFTPSAGYIVDIINYPDTALKSDAAIYKLVHAFLTPQLLVVSGISSVSFTVSALNIVKFFIGSPVRLHNYAYTIDSGDDDIFVTAIDTGTNTITVGTSLGFTPSAGILIDLIGYKDGGGPYRFI